MQESEANPSTEGHSEACNAVTCEPDPSEAVRAIAEVHDGADTRSYRSDSESQLSSGETYEFDSGSDYDVYDDDERFAPIRVDEEGRMSITDGYIDDLII